MQVIGQSGRPRMPQESYFTPQWVVDELVLALTDLHPQSEFIWECACGRGDIAQALWRRNLSVYASDIAPMPALLGVNICKSDFLNDAPPEMVGHALNDPSDYLQARRGPIPPFIITNPPYGVGGRMAEDFVARAVAIAKPARGRVAMLLSHEFDCGRTRRKFFAEEPGFWMKLVLTRRIRWANLQQGGHGPKKNHAWFIWDFRAPDKATGYNPQIWWA